MFWQVINTNLYLQGSIHNADEPLKLSKEAQAAAELCDTFVFEGNFHKLPNLDFAFYSNNSGLSKHIPKALFESTQELWKQAGLTDNLDTNRPWFATLKLTQALYREKGLVDANGLDKQIFKWAEDNNKKFYFLETILSGLQALSSTPLSEQQDVLSLVVHNPEKVVSQLQAMLVAWKDGNANDLYKIVEENLRLTPKMTTKLFSSRNHKWLPQLLNFAKSGEKVFVTVGALHLSGPADVVSLLAAKGYQCKYFGT
ncbi:MAG: TraB/GumN family protein [Aquabacterium sp.]|uniref:TraB/GumN family protein n=1 Tax=Aquabacterium sp. TaxID=1872578 RepID=UPI0027256AE6|nr:TraB/GumN family protein [Aquabacterium sp.]MDO9003597.1 TraB/GumN family protein [Aquabacterium sp.]